MKTIFNNKNTSTKPEGFEEIFFGMGCFWGAEKIFWNLNGVYSTSVGYAGGKTKNPTYEDVCSGSTNHAEVVKVVYNPVKIKFLDLLVNFWEGHDPTQGMRQGNDFGTQYRSIIITSNEKQKRLAKETKLNYEKNLIEQGFSKITTEIIGLETFFYAEEYHQQYLKKNPSGYCGIAGCNVKYN